MADLISRAAAITVLASSRYGDYFEAMDKMENIPSVEAVPVVHGRWIEKEVSENTIDEWQSAKCTNCGKYHTTPYLYYLSDYKYCPNCGSKNKED